VSLLDDILSEKRSQLEAIRQLSGPFAPREVRSLLQRRDHEPLRLAAEIKFKSPSAGALSIVLSLEERALLYAAAGVQLISVLCDERFFGGSFSHLSRVRTALETAGHEARVLAKEFVIDQAQIRAAASMGADAVLLIVRILEPAELASMTALALALGIEPIVEIVDERELELAVQAGARVIGVNARDLDTLQMDHARAERVLAAIPEGMVAMHLSGLREASDVARVAAGRADAALIGEALMRCDDPRALLGEVVRAATVTPG
jgi:indole-3-glycerol phosphate synthase